MDGRRLLDVVTGVYVSLLIVTTSALVQWETVAPAFSLQVAVGIGLGIAAIAALLVSTIEDLAESVASLPVAAVTVGLPLLFLPYLLVVTDPGSTQALVAAAGVTAVLPGIGIPLGGGLLENRRQREAATEIAVVTVGDDDGNEWWTEVQLAGGVLLGIGIMVTGLGIAGGFLDSGPSLVTTLGGLVTTVASLLGDDNRELTVTDAGLGVDRGFTRWERFDGFRVTDDEIELVRPEWYQATKSFEREEISDEAALVDGLDRYLPQLDDEGETTDTRGETTPEPEYS